VSGRRRVIQLAVCAILLLCGLAEAQQPKKIFRVAYLAGTPPSGIAHRTEAFRQGLRELGYIEGKNIAIEYRYADGKLDRLPMLVAELLRLKVDVIVTGGPAPTRAAKEATTRVPIVMAQDGDPVGNGFVASLARPGGNITGLSTLAPELNGKRLELLQEIIPKLARVAVFSTSTQPGNAQELKEVELAAEALGLKLQHLDVLAPPDFVTAFGEATKGRAGAVLALVPGRIANFKEIAELAVKNRLPLISRTDAFLQVGGLISYSVSLADLDRRAATYVDKILKGAKPAELPVEQPTRFELMINLKTAKQIGLTIPPHVLARADKVVK
jgi:putative tryptophan/tyrosine transport system substrate-binding protein